MMEQRSTEKAHRYEPHVVSFVHTFPNVLEKLANILTSCGKGKHWTWFTTIHRSIEFLNGQLTDLYSDFLIMGS